MEKYKDYVARTQQDRIALDTLVALEQILELLKPKYNDEQIVTDKVVEQIKVEVTQKKPRKKNGGDK